MGTAAKTTGESIETLAFTIDEFAQAFRLSRATLYNLWRAGGGPQRMRVRGRVLTGRAAAETWRAELESRDVTE